jgi:hypothetical protein
MRISTLLLLVPILLTNCKKVENDNYYLKKVVLVDIIQTSLPKVAIKQRPIEIYAFAQAENGCYSKFNFTMNKLTDFNYTLEAEATFETNGTCPTVMTGKDTTINFIPEKEGIYILNINKKPFKIRSDTVIVK